ASNARGQPPVLIGRSGGRPVDKRSECRRRILYEGPARDRQISAACLLLAGRRQRSPSPVCGPLDCAYGDAPTDPGRAGLGGPSPRRPVPGLRGGVPRGGHSWTRRLGSFSGIPLTGFASRAPKSGLPAGCRCSLSLTVLRPLRSSACSRGERSPASARRPCRPRPRCGGSFPEPRRKHALLRRRQGCRRAGPCCGRGSEHSQAACRLPA
ncbi:unnamed protein product, partial [Ixodes pacificus]